MRLLKTHLDQWPTRKGDCRCLGAGVKLEREIAYTSAAAKRKRVTAAKSPSQTPRKPIWRTAETVAFSPQRSIRAKAKKLDRLKSFVTFCLKRKWLTEDITNDLQAPAGSSVTLPKAPFTDEELADIYAACDLVDPSRRNWTGEDAILSSCPSTLACAYPTLQRSTSARVFMATMFS